MGALPSGLAATPNPNKARVKPVKHCEWWLDLQEGLPKKLLSTMQTGNAGSFRSHKDQDRVRAKRTIRLSPASSREHAAVLGC